MISVQCAKSILRFHNHKKAISISIKRCNNGTRQQKKTTVAITMINALVWHSIFDTATTLCPPPLLELHLSIYQEEQIVALNCILYPYITVSNIWGFRKQQGKHNFTPYYYYVGEFFFLSSNAILFHLLLASSPVFFFLHNGTCLHLLCATSL